MAGFRSVEAGKTGVGGRSYEEATRSGSISERGIGGRRLVVDCKPEPNRWSKEEGDSISDTGDEEEGGEKGKAGKVVPRAAGERPLERGAEEERTDERAQVRTPTPRGGRETALAEGVGTDDKESIRSVTRLLLFLI